MNQVARLSLVDRADAELSIVTQCRLLKVARSSLYWRPAAVSEDDLRLMRRIDELYLAAPFYGARRMVAVLCRDGWTVNRKRVRRLMRVMRIEAIYQKPNTSRHHPDHIVYPYLLRGLAINRPNQVWCADITYIPLAKGFVYLIAVMDWFSRRVLAWRLSTGMDGEFCVEALREAIDRFGSPDIFNTDQGIIGSASASSSLGEHFQGRALLTPDEIMRLGPTKPIILIAGEPPYLLDRVNYLTDPAYAGRFDPNPMHAPQPAE
jgi:putative transposase